MLSKTSDPVYAQNQVDSLDGSKFLLDQATQMLASGHSNAGVHAGPLVNAAVQHQATTMIQPGNPLAKALLGTFAGWALLLSSTLLAFAQAFESAKHALVIVINPAKPTPEKPMCQSQTPSDV